MLGKEKGRTRTHAHACPFSFRTARLRRVGILRYCRSFPQLAMDAESKIAAAPPSLSASSRIPPKDHNKPSDISSDSSSGGDTANYFLRPPSFSIRAVRFRYTSLMRRATLRGSPDLRAADSVSMRFGGLMQVVFWLGCVVGIWV